MLTRTALLLASFLAGASPAFCAPTPPSVAGSRTTTQLPRSARPTRYDLTITPDAAAMTFAGEVEISLDIISPTNTITLNSAGLTVDSSRLLSAGGTSIGSPHVILDETAQTATFSFDHVVLPGQYRLHINYRGAIQKSTTGLFALDYDGPGGKPARALFTQFENSDARRLLPCWDEPSFKAVFALKVALPIGDKAVSNMPVISDNVVGTHQHLISFADTPVMSAYLLFLGAGDLERESRRVDGVDVGVFTRRGSLSKATFALDSAAEVLPWLNSYFGLRYPLPKLDNIAGPGQSQTFGAMENWGAIFTFERGFLLDPAATSERERAAIFLNLSHEMAHQWFGDLVTMSWWDDLWLNEGFASWMEEEASKQFHPEWHADLDSIGYRDGAMDDDSLATTHPIIQHVQTVEQAGEAFDWITYMKGEAVIHMLETYVGHDRWRDSVRRYIRAHQFANTTSEDLWRELGSVAGPDAVQIAHDFTLQPGVPLISVSDTCEAGQTRIDLHQSEWVKDRPGKAPLLWHVPVLAAHPGDSPTAALVVGTGTMTAPGCGPIIVNAGHHGYYRTLYSPAMFAELAKAYSHLSPADQMGIMADASALGTTGQQPMSDVLGLIDHLPSGAPARIMETAVRTWKQLYDYAEGDAATEAALRRFAIRRFVPALDALGWQPKASDTSAESTLRGTLIELLGDAAVPAVVDEARRLYLADATGGPALPATVKTSILRAVARNADQSVWDRLRAQAKAETSMQQKATLYGLLGRARDSRLQDETLALALTEEPGATTSPAMIQAVSVTDPERAVRFTLGNEAHLLGELDSMSATSFIPDLASRSHEPAMISTLQAYASTKQANGGSTHSAYAAIASIKDTIRIRTSIMPAVREWLAHSPSDHDNATDANANNSM